MAGRYGRPSELRKHQLNAVNVRNLRQQQIAEQARHWHTNLKDIQRSDEGDCAASACRTPHFFPTFETAESHNSLGRFSWSYIPETEHKEF
jgi:hypothetical protein